MAHITFDTLAFHDALVDSGFSAPQARGLVENMQKIELEQVATRADIQRSEAATRSLEVASTALETHMRAEFVNVRNEAELFRQETKSEFKEIRSEIYAIKRDIRAWLIPMILGLYGLLIPLLLQKAL